ncbi:ribosomal protein S18 acetylase RimI-like enzyme [Peptoniphilus olsenii]|uniref:Ribosomal protein S18 acetylase RimI-like enzyme n=1 Tax=Peptoniphilus olsenii TaxID=411570 RepID=A0ABV2JC29_9FIRM
MKYIEDLPTAKAYNELRMSSGFGNTKDEALVEKALKGSLYVISVYDKENLVGFGRIVGDGGITFVVSDIMVDIKYQRKGIANKIMYYIDNWFDTNTEKGRFIILIADKPADKLYLHHDFHKVQTNYLIHFQTTL